MVQLREPIVQAPLAGGPSTPELAAAVSQAGGLGFVAAGYRKPGQVADEIAAVRFVTDAPFGVNLFVPSRDPVDEDAVARYAERLRTAYPEAELGEPRSDDDAWEEKLELVGSEKPAVVSFTFGIPNANVIAGLDSEVWITVTTPEEAEAAVAAGADALVVQGAEAGGHRGGPGDRPAGDIGLLALLQLVRARVDVPLIATGGIATGRAVAAVLVAGAAAAQVGTAFMLTPEAGTSPAQRAALRTGGRTALTRAFTGRTARGLENTFLREHSAGAPSAYPHVHHLTAPLRASARERGDAEAINLWAGQAHALAQAVPAGELVRRLGADARAALRQ
jgi:nitronate monooxygenase